MQTSYLLPADETIKYESEIKHSTFITHIARVMNSEEARAFIDSIKSTYPDATHNCSAYIHHVDGALPVERSSDDGEPNGTAGKPMLDQLKGSGMLDIAAVVTRYFGGIKLGAGGLVSAYSNSVGDALPLVKRVRRSLRELYIVEFDHAEAGRYEADLRAHNVSVVGVEYAATARYTLAVAPGEKEMLADALASLTAGRVQPSVVGTAWIETAV